jgi:glyoxylase-like metal-dependent hydrolase (beta-lactamase superfamily II)
MWKMVSAAALLPATVLVSTASASVEKLAPDLYAYISENDHSANSTFLIGKHGILVVDTGLNNVEGQKLLKEIRALSTLPVQFIVNTHYHPDHQGGNGVVGPDAVVITSAFTRERTLQLISRMQADRMVGPLPAYRAATETLEKKLTVFLDDVPIEIILVGAAHTMGDVYVYFPKQKTAATGDLYLTNSSPAMDQGSASNWIRALDAMLALPVDHFVPGHFEVGTRATMTRYRDYLADLYAQVEKLKLSGATAAEVRERIDVKKYSDFRQYPQFQATFADNAEAIYRQLQGSQ